MSDQRAGHDRPDRFAVVDIGSNTAKLTVYACDDGRLEALHHDADTVRIGYRVTETRQIDGERLARLIATLERFEQATRQLGATLYRAVATQAFRNAGNAGESVA